MEKHAVTTASESQTSRFLEFDLGKEHYAMPLLSVWEVIPVPETTPIPKAPAHMVGIMNLRGQVITVVDLRKKLKITPKEVDQEEAVIIVDVQGVKIGVVVDAINRVLTIKNDQLLQVADMETQVNAKFIQGVFQRDDGLTIMVDIMSILDVQDLKIVKGAKAA